MLRRILAVATCAAGFMFLSALDCHGSVTDAVVMTPDLCHKAATSLDKQALAGEQLDGNCYGKLAVGVGLPEGS